MATEGAPSLATATVSIGERAATSEADSPPTLESMDPAAWPEERLLPLLLLSLFDGGLSESELATLYGQPLPATWYLGLPGIEVRSVESADGPWSRSAGTPRYSVVPDLRRALARVGRARGWAKADLLESCVGVFAQGFREADSAAEALRMAELWLDAALAMKPLGADAAAEALREVAGILLSAGRAERVLAMASDIIARLPPATSGSGMDVAADLWAICGRARLLSREGPAALADFARAREGHERAGDFRGEANDVAQMAQAMAAMDRLGEAFGLYTAAMEIRERVGDDRSGLARDAANLGRLLLRMGNPADAAVALRRAAETFAEAGEPHMAQRAARDAEEAESLAASRPLDNAETDEHGHPHGHSHGHGCSHGHGHFHGHDKPSDPSVRS